jgi:diaminopimelate decarboxylase
MADTTGTSAEHDPVAEAYRLVEEDTKTRMDACRAEIEEVLDRHGFRLIVEPGRATLTAKE